MLWSKALQQRRNWLWRCRFDSSTNFSSKSRRWQAKTLFVVRRQYILAPRLSWLIVLLLIHCGYGTAAGVRQLDSKFVYTTFRLILRAYAPKPGHSESEHSEPGRFEPARQWASVSSCGQPYVSGLLNNVLKNHINKSLANRTVLLLRSCARNSWWTRSPAGRSAPAYAGTQLGVANSPNRSQSQRPRAATNRRRILCLSRRLHQENLAISTHRKMSV